MFKFILKHSINFLVEPIVNLILKALEDLADRTSNTIDDDFVDKFIEYKESIIGWILSNSNKIF